MSMLSCCVYTGREVWSVELPGVGEFFTSPAHEEQYQPGTFVYFPSHHGANFVGSNYVSTADSVYVIHNDRCLRLDLDDGRTLGVFDLPGREQLRALLDGRPAPSYAARIASENERRWGHIRVLDNYLVVAAYPHLFGRRPERPELDSGGEGSIAPESGVPWHWNATSSEYLIVLNRKNGALKWVRQARHGFRHNAIAAAAGRVFAVDHLSEEVWSWLQRRGIEPDIKPAIAAFDLVNGRTLWTYDDHVFGTWLAYSARHDVLLQSGRPGGRSWLPDEPRDKFMGLRGVDGVELWRTRHRAWSEPALHEDQRRILPLSIDIRSGESIPVGHPLTGSEEPWRLAITKRCGTFTAARHLVTFRSSMASYHDLYQESGTANLAGVRAGCTNNMIVADGMLNVPDYTRSCICAYQLQTSFGLVSMPDVDMWTVNRYSNPEPGTIRNIGINFGAPGSRISDGLLWLSHPTQEHVLAPQVPIELETAENSDVGWFSKHSLKVTPAAAGAYPWVASTGVQGVRLVRLDGLFRGEPGSGGVRYTVRLHFSEPTEAVPGQRVFSIRIQGVTVLTSLDLTAVGGAPGRALVFEFTDIALDRDGALVVELVPDDGSELESLLCGLEVRQEAE